MFGITAIETYLPMYRLQREEIARVWHTRELAGSKSVAGYDEDSVTMAVAATRACLGHKLSGINGLYFAGTTAPYLEKLSSAIIADAVGLGRKCITADFAHSLRSGSTALISAYYMVQAGSMENMMVSVADCRTGKPRSAAEQNFGDGAATIVIGSEQVIAEIESTFSLSSEFIDYWRQTGDRFVRSGEDRFISDEGYAVIIQEAVSGILESQSLRPSDITRIVFSAAGARQHGKIAGKLGMTPEQVQDPLFDQVGHLGSAGVFVMLRSALADVNPGDRILMVNYGDGADAILFRATDSITRFQDRIPFRDRASSVRSIDYGTYLSWRELIELDETSLPPRYEPSLATRWRERNIIATLSGVKCNRCGTPQLSSIGQNIRICINCQAKDDFTPYSFADKKATLFTYSVDHLQPTKNPPGVNGVIDFEGGGRLICELTDYDLDRINVGMPLEMTFRKMAPAEAIVNYFWKAKPATTPE